MSEDAFKAMSRDDLERELQMAVGVVRMFLWVHANAHADDRCVSPLDAYQGKVRTEYLKALAYANRWKR